MAYSKVTPELAEQLKGLVGEGRFFYGADVPEDYCHDEMPIYGKAFPEAVCEVESTEEVAAIMKFCNEHRIPVTPRGAEAERLLEAARSMGKRKCGGDLSALSPHEAEAFCGILDYLSKIYEGRGMKDAIRPLIDEVRATGTDSPVAAWMLDRL